MLFFFLPLVKVHTPSQRNTIDFTRNVSILKKSEIPILISTSDIAIEKAKDILVDQVLNQNERSSVQSKRVKMSKDSLLKDGNKGWSNLVTNKRDSKSSKISVKELLSQKSADDTIYMPSFENTRKTLNQLPQYVLDNIQTEDSNFTIKYVSS